MCIKGETKCDANGFFFNKLIMKTQNKKNLWKGNLMGRPAMSSDCWISDCKTEVSYLRSEQGHMAWGWLLELICVCDKTELNLS